MGRGAEGIAEGLKSIGRNRRFPRLRALGARLNPFAIRIRSRVHLNDYWRATARKLSRGQFFRINPFRFAVYLFRDAKVCALFSLSVLAMYSQCRRSRD